MEGFLCLSAGAISHQIMAAPWQGHLSSIYTVLGLAMTKTPGMCRYSLFMSVRVVNQFGGGGYCQMTLTVLPVRQQENVLLPWRPWSLMSPWHTVPGKSPGLVTVTPSLGSWGGGGGREGEASDKHLFCSRQTYRNHVRFPGFTVLSPPPSWHQKQIPRKLYQGEFPSRVFLGWFSFVCLFVYFVVFCFCFVFWVIDHHVDV